jgi:hypothetical protein
VKPPQRLALESDASLEAVAMERPVDGIHHSFGSRTSMTTWTSLVGDCCAHRPRLTLALVLALRGDPDHVSRKPELLEQRDHQG